MHVNEALFRLRHIEERVARRRDLAQAFADDERHIGVAHAGSEPRVDADADIACIVAVTIVKKILAAKRARDGQPVRFGELPQRRAGRGIPATAADEHERPAGARENLPRACDLSVVGRRAHGIYARGIGACGRQGSRLPGGCL